MSGSLTPTFHQEMLNYHLSPSYEYQEPLWRKYKSDHSSKALRSVNGLGRALWFMSSLFMKRYRQRKSAYVFYGTMTGTSKMFCSTLTKCLDQLFQTKMLPLTEDSMTMMENMKNDKNSVIFIITSTTGNGEPPHHAISFKSSIEEAQKKGDPVLDGLRYAVFALGSSIYENFCTFGIFCDQSLESLGGQRVAPLALGDEQKGQDKAFRAWTKMALLGACQAFELEIPKEIEEKWPFSRTRTRKASWVPHSFRTTNKIDDVKKLHGIAMQNVSLMSTVLVSKKKLSARYCLLTLGFPSNPSLRLMPGDHVYVFPENDPELVKQVIARLDGIPGDKEIVVWAECDVPPSTLRKALTHFLDLNSCQNPDQMQDWIQFCSQEADKEAIGLLCEDNKAFLEWRNKRPNVLDFLKAFPSCKIPAASLVASLTKLMPRPYSIASISPKLALVGGQNIPVADVLLEVCEMEIGPFQDDQGT